MTTTEINHTTDQKFDWLNPFKKYTWEQKICFVLLFLLIWLVYAVRSSFFDMPFERDEGAYTYYGKLLLEGKIPYKDFYEQKFPGIFYFYAMMISLFGEGVREMHRGFFYLNAVNIALIYYIVLRIFSSPSTALISAATFGFLSLTPYISGFTVQAEHGVAFFCTLGILCCVLAMQTKKWYYYLLLGLAMGAAFMTKTSGVFLGLWAGLFIIIDFFFEKERVYKDLFKRIGLYSAGGFAVILVLFLLIYMKGSFKEMLFWSFDIPKYYVNRMPLEEGLKIFYNTKFLLSEFNYFFWVHSLAGFLLLLVRGIPVKIKLFVFTLALFSIATIVPGYYFYGHYWLQMIPAMAVLSGVTFYGIISLFKVPLKNQVAIVSYGYLVVFGFFTFKHFNLYRKYYFSPNFEIVLREIYGTNPFNEVAQISGYLNQKLKPGDEIAVIGSEPQIYLYTHRKSPTKHIFFSTIVSGVPQHKQWQREYTSSIEKQKPRYIIYVTGPMSLLVQPNTDPYIFNWVKEYITENYTMIGFTEIQNLIRTGYVWKKKKNNRGPISQEPILIYERNDLAFISADSTALIKDTTTVKDIRLLNSDTAAIKK